jgi:hypothetical protein
MKRTLLTTLATMGLALGVFAQGAIDLNNQAANGGIVVQGTSNGSSLSGLDWLTGTAGLEVWFLNSSSFNNSLINSFNTSGGNPQSAYAALTANGFTKATTITGASLTSGGFALGQINMTGCAVGTETIAIAAWQGSGASFGSGKSGVLSFYMNTVDSTAQPPPTALKLNEGAPASPSANGGFNSFDLILNTAAATPEPSTFALAGLGAAALLIFRRRK